MLISLTSGVDAFNPFRAEIRTSWVPSIAVNVLDPTLCLLRRWVSTSRTISDRICIYSSMLPDINLAWKSQPPTPSPPTHIFTIVIYHVTLIRFQKQMKNPKAEWSVAWMTYQKLRPSRAITSWFSLGSDPTAWWIRAQLCNISKETFARRKIILGLLEAMYQLRLKWELPKQEISIFQLSVRVEVHMPNPASYTWAVVVTLTFNILRPSDVYTIQ